MVAWWVHHLHALHQSELLVLFLKLVDEEHFMHFCCLVQGFAADRPEVGIAQLSFARLLLLQVLLAGQLSLLLYILNSLQCHIVWQR